MTRKPIIKGLFLTVLAAVATFGCAEQMLEPETAMEEPFLSKNTGSTVTEVHGRIGPGSEYALFVPTNWNGDLALYAHGFIDPALPIDLPTADDIEPLRDELVALGYAVAYSSFSENGLAIKDGARRTQQLRGIFVSKFSVPERTYLMGHSLGGLVAIMLAEQYPNHYAGALPMCGMIGGSQAEIDYVANVRVLFDFCYPDALPGDALDIPKDFPLSDVISAVAGAIIANPDCAGIISQIDQTPIPFDSPEHLVESFVTAIGFNFRGFQDVFDRTHNHNPFDNSATVYTSASPFVPGFILDAINATVDRFESTPDADQYLIRYYEPTGKLEIPVLTLHNLLDPVVPLFHEEMYRQTVAAAGNSDLLVQRTITNPIYGHCDFGVATMAQAFLDLVNWVENGVTPSP
jgi:pimeloyl-ACP methyl ester carboxylesterase